VLVLEPVERVTVERVEAIGLEAVFSPMVTSEGALGLRAEFDDEESEPVVEDTGLIALLQATEGISCWPCICSDTS
jgi:hypothetical protein